VAWRGPIVVKGVHTGDVVVGNIGSHKRTKYGVVGSHVNLTSRIQSYTIGGQILVSAVTQQEIGPLGRLSKQMEVEAKGIAEPITLYELRGIGGAYGLFLPAREEELVSLQQQIPLQYTVLEGQHIGRTVYKGHFITLSAKGGEVRSDHAVAPWRTTARACSSLTPSGTGQVRKSCATTCWA
jgi:adenylate cyclase